MYVIYIYHKCEIYCSAIYCNSQTRQVVWKCEVAQSSSEPGWSWVEGCCLIYWLFVDVCGWWMNMNERSFMTRQNGRTPRIQPSGWIHSQPSSWWENDSTPGLASFKPSKLYIYIHIKYYTYNIYIPFESFVSDWNTANGSIWVKPCWLVVT
jgi:hypothetical protein